MNGFEQFLYNILSGINSVVNNYGIAIMVFTLLIRMICMPFDYRSRKGMKKMQVIQPKLNELQKKYKDDPRKLQQKQAELMQKEGYSMFSSCLPMLLTYPLMIAMFAAMRAIANEHLAMQALSYLAGEENVLSVADRFLWVNNIWMTDSPFSPIAPLSDTLKVIPIDVWQRTASALTEGQMATVAQNMGLDVGSTLDFTTAEAMQGTVAAIISALEALPAYQAAVSLVPGWGNLSFMGLFTLRVYQQFNGLLLLPVLSGVFQMLQTKLNPQMREQQQMQPVDPNNPNGGMNAFFKYVFPLMAVFFCLTSTAAFALYWVTSTVVMWIQSLIITKILDKQEEKKANSIAGEGSVH